MSADRTVAVLAAKVARQRLDKVAASIEANRWPGMVDTMRAILDALEGLLADAK
jgi:hypothetical protein